MHTTLFSGLFTLALGASIAMPAGAQEVLPFPLKPSGSVAGKTMQQSTYTPLSAVNRLPEGRAQHPHRPDRRRRAGPDQHLRRPDQHADDGADRQGRHRLQPLSHHRDVLAHARGAADAGETSTASRSGQIAELANDWDGYAGHHPQEQRHGGRGAQGLRLRHLGVRQVAQHAGRADDRRRARSTTGPRATGSSTSTGSSPARRRSTSRAWCATRPTSNTRILRAGTSYYHLSEDLADDAINWLRRHKAFAAGQAVLHVLGQRCDPTARTKS